MSKPILNYDEQAARIKVLEKALVKSEEDYDQVRLDYWRLFDENKRLLDEIYTKGEK
jgi:hypothetical protein